MDPQGVSEAPSEGAGVQNYFHNKIFPISLCWHLCWWCKKWWVKLLALSPDPGIGANWSSSYQVLPNPYSQGEKKGKLVLLNDLDEAVRMNLLIWALTYTVFKYSIWVKLGGAHTVLLLLAFREKYLCNRLNYNWNMTVFTEHCFYLEEWLAGSLWLFNFDYLADIFQKSTEWVC